MDIKRAFEILNLKTSASNEAVKNRYHELAVVWHPDLHGASSELQKLSNERMKEINSAYEAIQLYLKSFISIKCKFCGGENKRRIDFNVDYTTCSNCGKQLLKPLIKKQREPCGNDRCAGTIGHSGRCNYCGKTIEEGRSITSCSAYNINEYNLRKLKRPNQHNNKIKILISLVSISCLLISFYIYSDKLFKKISLQTSTTELAVEKSFESIISAIHDDKESFIGKSNSRPFISDDSFYSTFFNNRDVKKEDAIKLQQILKIIGYEIGKTDGLIAKNTISCFKQYCMDFGYVPKAEFPECFFNNSYFHYQISLKHKDWLEIYLTSDLESWIRAQSENHRKIIYELSLNNPNTVVQLLRRYKFEKFKPLPIYLPETGIIKKNYSGSNAYLKIKTKAEINNFLSN